MPDHTRQLIKIVKEICAEYRIAVRSYSYDWILQLTGNQRTMFIYGYKFPQNNASAEHICNDKAALSDVLEECGIPHVPHFYFMAPTHPQYTGPNGDWERLIAIFEQYGPLVCKTNTGSGGRNVIKVETRKNLEQAVFELFSMSHSMAVSPYVRIAGEYRVIVLEEHAEVIYQKQRPFVTGTGTDPIWKLIRQDPDLDGIEADLELDWERIPAAGETVDVSWKHNLGQGAVPVVVPEGSLHHILADLALSCAAALGLRFASIDIIKDNEGYQILEINSGIMMENFAKSSLQNYQTAKEIYRKAILQYLGMEPIKNG